jgi:hypothetical protein
MSRIPTHFNTALMRGLEPGLNNIFWRLGANENSFFLADASDLPGLFEPADHHLPVLFLSSKRLKQLETHGPDTSEPRIVLGDYDPDLLSSNCYLTWAGTEFCIAIDSTALSSVFCNALHAPAHAFIVWVTGSTMTISLLSASEEFVDLLESAQRACSLPRLETSSDSAQISAGNHSAYQQKVACMLSLDGQPVYVAVSTNDQKDPG